MLTWIKLLIIALSVFLVIGIVAVIILAISGAGKKKETNGEGSYFDGGTLQLIGWRILASLLTSITCGIAFPWAMCMLKRWEVKHTVINGRRLKFTGNGAQLFGKYLLWAFLTVITCGIYSIWFGLGMKKWEVKHTVYEDNSSEFESKFTGGAGGWFVNHVLIAIAGMFTFGIAVPWAQVHLMKWEAEHTVINGSPLAFAGTGGQLFVKNLLLGILTPITCGIYAIFYPVKILKWQYSNTQALYRTAPIQKLAHDHEEGANVDFAKFGLAANEAELAVLKSGINGNETAEQLEELKNAGNPYAMYMLSQMIDDQQQIDEYIRLSASAKYHPALFKYAQTFANTDEVSFVGYLEESAKCGNSVAPWILKNFYENKAKSIKNFKEILDILKKEAYWFKIAIEQNHPDAVQAKDQYNKLVENIAIRISNDHVTVKGASAGIIVAAIAGILAIILALGVVLAFFGITPVLRFGGNEAKRENENLVYPITANGQSQSAFSFERIIEDDENITSNAKYYDSEYSEVDKYIKENYSEADYGDGIHDALKQRTIEVKNNFSNAFVSYQIKFNIYGADSNAKEILVYDTSSGKFTVVDDFTYEGVIKNYGTQRLYIIIIVKTVPEDKFTSWFVEYDYKHLEFLSVEKGEEPVNDTQTNTENAPELSLDRAKELIEMKNEAHLLYHFKELGMLDESKTYRLSTFDGMYETCYAVKGIETVDDLKQYLCKYYTEAYAQDMIENKSGYWRIENNVIYFEPNYGMGSNIMSTDGIIIESLGNNRYTVTSETEWSGPRTIYVFYENGDYKIDLFIGPEFTKADAWNLVYNLYEMEHRTLKYFENKGMVDKNRYYDRTVLFFGDNSMKLTAYALKDIDNAEELRNYVYGFCTPDYHLARHGNPSVDAKTADSFMDMWFTEGGTIYVSEQYDYPWFIKAETLNVKKTDDGYFVTVNEYAAGDPNGNPENKLNYTIIYKDGKYVIDSWSAN